MIPAGPLEAAALECLGSFLMLNNLIRSVAEPAAHGEINPPNIAEREREGRLAPSLPPSFPPRTHTDTLAPTHSRSHLPLPGLLAFFYGALNTSFNQLYNFNLAQLLTRMADEIRKTPQIAGWFNSAIFHGLLAFAAKLQPSPAWK